MKKFCLLVLLVFMVCLTACSEEDDYSPKAADASPDAIPNLVGEYAVNGFDPMGTEYGGRLSVRPGETETQYLMQWIIVGSIQEGVGILQGNQLLVEWKSVEGMAATQGQARYTITEAGELYGSKTVAGLETEGSEIAFPNE
jgi:hypothetical protein